MSTKTLPRGIRNHNPGNIERGDPWQGLAADQSQDDRFAVFKSPVWGIRALARLLITYQDRHNLRTVQSIINRWAPPVGSHDGSTYIQDTTLYANQVASNMRVDVGQPINVHEYRYMYPLVEAIIEHENGIQPYSKEQINEGLRRAGIVSEQISDTKKDPAAIGSGLAVGSGTAAAIAGTISETASTTQEAIIPFLNFEVAQYLFIGLAVIGAATSAYVVVQRHRKDIT